MATALEQSFADICAKHDLTSFHIGYHIEPNLRFWTANAHWSGFGVTGLNCASEHSYDSLAEAVAKTLAQAAVNRTPPAVEIADEAILIAEAA